MDRSPSRRAFATVAVPLLAGCIGSPTDGRSNDSAPSDDPPNADRSSDTDPGQSNCGQSIESPDPYPDVRIEMDSVPDDADVNVRVTPIEPFSDDSPARIAFALTNSDVSVEYVFGVTPPYGGVYADRRRGNGALYLIPDDREHIAPAQGLIPAAPTDGCWRSQSSIGVEDIGLTETIDPGETIREEYTLVAAPEGECLAPDTYRSQQRGYDPVGEVWGFDVTLSR